MIWGFYHSNKKMMGTRATFVEDPEGQLLAIYRTSVLTGLAGSHTKGGRGRQLGSHLKGPGEVMAAQVPPIALPPLPSPHWVLH